MNYFAALLVLTGYALLARRRSAGFIVQICGCVIYVVLFWNVDWSIVLVNGIFAVISVFGFRTWRSLEVK